jgi:hypothetical protein
MKTRLQVNALLFTGSGSLAAMAVFEDRYKINMEVCWIKSID